MLRHNLGRRLLRSTSHSRISTTTSTSIHRYSSNSHILAPRSLNKSQFVAASRSRQFSVSALRLKDDSDRKSTNQSDQSLDVDKTQSEESNDLKSRTPDPVPPSKPSDARGSTSGSGDGDSGDSGGGSNSGSGGGNGRRRKTSDKSLQKPTVPDVYPQLMAIPIARRPLFPGFYKAITIRNPDVMAAIDSAMKMGQPYIGAFLLRDEEADKDVIEKMEDVYEVGTFCQITSAFTVNGNEPSMTAVLYPHRKIKMTSLIAPSKQKDVKSDNDNKVDDKSDASQLASAQVENVDTEQTQKSVASADDTTTTSKPTGVEQPQEIDEKKGDVVASFEESSSTDPKAQAKDSKSANTLEPASFLKKYKVSFVNVDNWKQEPFDKKDKTIRALIAEIVNVFRDIANQNTVFRDQISALSVSQNSGNIGDDPGKLADFAAAVSNGDANELQDALEAPRMEDRLHKALVVLKYELGNAQLQSKISKDVESKIHKRQREYFLMEQMKGIKKELGLENDGKDKLIQGFKEKAAALTMPEHVTKVFDEELSKLQSIEQASAEFNVTRNYLDWITQIPWGKASIENFDVAHAIKVLNEDHHGLKDVKDRILEFIAVGKLRGTVQGKIILLVGPPGTGKTSIAKSIARALSREYYRFSVGGLSDVSELKGHRRTYIGSMPGRIIQALKRAGTENPLVLIDEVDKLGRGVQGDPASALLEILDPEQNQSFVDHYMDIPIDLSRVLFVSTANSTDTIPKPLLDRMEVIELSGYIGDEKMAIAEKYLSPTAKEQAGLKGADVLLEDDAIQELINKYCRESGVRNLKQQIEKVYRKAALQIVKDLGEDGLPESEALNDVVKEEKKDTTSDQPEQSTQTTQTPRKALQVPENVSLRINAENLKDFVGPPIFTSDRLYETLPPGVSFGLAWTSMGGAALYIECILENALSHSSKPSFERTGNFKNVMLESSRLSYSFVKNFMATKFPENKFFSHASIHLHSPEGAIKKDGPSAGITIASSLLSLAFNHPLDPQIAMTGELTVTGKVLRIGGLREKTIAAKRAGATTVIFPKDNLSDWLELPANIKEGIEGKPVDWYSEVFDVHFKDLDHAKANSLWKDALEKKKKKKSDDDDD